MGLLATFWIAFASERLEGPKVSAPTLSSLLGGVLNGEILSSAVDFDGSRFVLLGIKFGFEGTLGLSARLTGGGTPFAGV